MKLTAPIYVLKSRARQLKRNLKIPLSEALNLIAQDEGYASWSLLMSQRQALLPNSVEELRDYLNPGDMVLLGARPRIGKTVFATELLRLQSSESRVYVFSLADRVEDVTSRLQVRSTDKPNPNVQIDCSDAICADYIVDQLGEVEPGCLVVIDYLQLLCENREHSPLQQQVELLTDFARRSGCIFVLLSQLDRQVDSRPNQRPEISDIRSRNPLDIDLFNKLIFLHRGDSDAPTSTVSLLRPVSHAFDFAPV